MARPPRVSGRRVWQRTRVNWNKGTAVASAALLALPNDGNVFALTGTTTITHLATTNWNAGAIVVLLFDTSITVTDTAGSNPSGYGSILLASGANMSATADDTLSLVFDGTNWREIGRAAI